ncbi:uncharacterized protein K02A2.6-like [Uranotaenia lowii]|uniref:uncharacterized protein K02A2.6-like n=1 Tax=Uranotaenia lowii TaxID=190385 RepID=UPI00247AA640|nr:uncharacterized protein K02A2.6-like [Uranotaenia lowii]
MEDEHMGSPSGGRNPSIPANANGQIGNNFNYAPRQHPVQQQQHGNPIIRPPLLPSIVPGTQPHFQQQQQQQQQQQPFPQYQTDPMLLQILQQMQQFIMHQQEVSQRHSNLSQDYRPPLAPNPEQILESLSTNINEFRYDPESGITFGAWYSRYDGLFTEDAARLNDEAKVRLLLRKLGPAEHERYLSFILPALPREIKFSDTVGKLKSLFGTVESLICRRYRCLQVSKQPSEDYRAYACRVNRLCIEFELGKLSEDEFKCLIFVCGLKSDSDGEIRTRLLSRIGDNSLVKLEQISDECQKLMTIKHDTAMIATQSVSTKVVNRKQTSNKWPERQKKNNPEGEMSKNYNRHQNKNNKSGPFSPCWCCGAMHYARDCTYRNHRCKACGGYGHKDGYCASAKKTNSDKRKLPSAATKSVQVKSVKQQRKYVTVQILGTPVKLQLDTASDISVISEKTWAKIGKPTTSPALVRASTASGQPLKLQAECTCDIEVNGVRRSAKFFIVKQPLHLLGIDLINLFDLWSIPMNQFCNQLTSSRDLGNAIKAAFPEVFSDVPGLCTKAKIKLTLRDGQSAVFRPKRPVAYAMYSTVDKELDRLEHANIITPVEYSAWAAPIVVVRKASGAIRICGDYSTGLNNALEANHKLDLSDAFLQVEVDESPRELLTINTHRGLYRYNRLSPRVKAAPGAFQQLVDTMLADLRNTLGYLDDVLIGGADEEEHNRNLKAALQRFQEYGFTIKAEKCSFGSQQIKYLGHLIDKHGLRPDPAKIDVIRNLPPPTDVTGVRSFLGAINYYGRFVPAMRTLRYPLDELLKGNKQFNWSADCQKAFDQFKTILASDLLLTHYSPELPFVVSADASSVGVGATISHKFPDGSVKVIQHASRALTAAEQAYGQADREGLALVFACTKFHKMLYGRSFTLQTDHAPLLRIFGSKKGIPTYTANRLQRWALQLLLYNFHIEYISTDKFGNADVLSRLINNHIKPDEDYIIASVNLKEDLGSVVANSARQIPLNFKAIQDATQSDPVLGEVFRFTLNGWPKSRKLIPDHEVQRFFDRQDSLSIVQGCVMFAERIAIPSKFRSQCLQQMHKGHPGIQRMKSIARSFVYWPSLDADIVKFLSSCKPCAMVAKSPPLSSPQPWPKPEKPWQRLHVDYAGPIEGDYFLLLVDSFSKWVEIVKTNCTTSAATIGILRGIFARFGMPITLVSDNGSQFTSAEFATFCVENAIHHVTTAPYHPQSNGQVERFVDTFKRSLRKIREGKATIQEALDTFLLTYRTTPNPVTGQSPADLIFGRPIRTCLELLRPPPTPNVPERQLEGKVRCFKQHDSVYAQLHSKNTWRWAAGIVLERVGRVMYNVWIEDSRMCRIHVNQMRSRSSSDTLTPDVPVDSNDQMLPLDILLREHNLQLPSAPSKTNVSSQRHSSPNVSNPGAPSHHSTPVQALHPENKASSPSNDASSLSASVPSSSSPSSTTTTRNSSGFRTAIETLPAVQQPRRSSRVRRAPQWFDPYQIY